MVINRSYKVLISELPALRKFTRYLTGNTEKGEDLFQDTVERAVRSIEHLNLASSPRAWLFTIARNRYIDGQRRLVSQPDGLQLNDDNHQADSMAGPDNVPFLRDLSRAFSLMPRELRDVAWLVGVEGFKYAEAADVLDVPVGTIRSRMFRAREALRLEMVDYWSEGRQEDGQ